METRVAIVSIIVSGGADTEELNNLLSEDAGYIIGRMGIPCRQKGVNIICVAIDAPQDVINTLSGRLGRLAGVTAKATYSNVVSPEEGDVPC